MQERRANLHRLPSRDCGEDTAESSSVPHGKASFCWAARLACCRHPAWLHTSCLHQAPVFLQAPQSPRSSGHPGSTDVTLKGLEQWLGSLPEPEPPKAALRWQDRASPAASAHSCSWHWFVARDTQVVHGLARVQSTSGSPEAGNALMFTLAGNQTCHKHAAADKGGPWGTSTRPRGCSEHLGSPVAVQSCHPSWTNRAALTPKAMPLRLSGDVRP